MSTYIRKNFASGILASDVLIGAAQLTLTSFHTLPTDAGDMVLVIWNEAVFANPANDAALEIVVAEYSGTPNVYNITRAQEGTIDVKHFAGDTVALHYTAGLSEDDLMYLGVARITETAIAPGKRLEVYNDAGSLKLRYVDIYPAGTAGYTTTEQSKLSGIAPNADVTADNAPKAHKTSHQNTGTDEISVAGLSGLLADDQHVLDSEVLTAAKTIKLDDFSTPDDNEDLNSSISAHGLLKKLDNVSQHFMSGIGTWASPTGATLISDQPITSAIEFTEIAGGKVGWTAGYYYYKGIEYSISANAVGTTDKYIYWDLNVTPTTFLTTNTLSEAYGKDRWVLCVNDEGTAYDIASGKQYWGEMLVAETLSAITAQLGNVVAGSITGTTISGGTIQTATSGRRISIDSDGIKFKMAAGGLVTVGTVGNGGTGTVVGTTANGGDEGIVGTGYLARFYNTDNGIPFEVVSEQVSIADLHLFPRGSDPTTGKSGDIALVNNKLRVCINNTPTWQDL